MEVCKKDGNSVTSKIVDGIKNIFNKNDGEKDRKSAGNGLLQRKQKSLDKSANNTTRACKEDAIQVKADDAQQTSNAGQSIDYLHSNIFRRI